MTEVFVLFNYFRSVQSLSFAFRKKAAFCRENSAICGELVEQQPDCMQQNFCCPPHEDAARAK